MTDNPYAAPRAELVTEPDTIGALFSYRQVGIATFLGGPFVAVWMLRSNYLGLRRDTLAHATLWSGLILSCLWLLLVLILPNSINGLPISIAQGGLAGWLAYEFHQKDPRRPSGADLMFKSNWLVLAVILAGAAASIAVLIGITLLLQASGYWKVL